MKTIMQALLDEVLYPIPEGFVENVIIKRGLSQEEDFSKQVSESAEYKGALADCLYSLAQAISFSEADKSIGALTDEQRKAILSRANKLYAEIGEEEKPGLQPIVYINC